MDLRLKTSELVEFQIKEIDKSTPAATYLILISYLLRKLLN